MLDVFSAIAWLIVLVLVGFFLAVLLVFIGLIGMGVFEAVHNLVTPTKARVTVEPTEDIEEPEETTEESEFDGLLGIDGETDEEQEESALFPPEYSDLLEDEDEEIN